MTDTTTTPVFCAIDTADLDHALALSAAMLRAECGIKLGLEFFNAQGPQGIRHIREAYPDLPLFIDLKYHDIPNTVAGAIRSISVLEPDYINVHAQGGLDMMQAAAEALSAQGETHTKILAVTILTSLNEDNIADTGMRPGLSERVVQLAKLTQQAGLDGVVCSSHEIELIRAACGPDFTLMVPGIRPAGSATGDQKRVMPPTDALSKGATHLVIGRPITQADNPAEAAQSILQSLS